MADNKYIAILPQKLNFGDRIRVKGSLSETAEQISMNFVNETCPPPLNVAYHMKWFIKTNRLVEDYKFDGEWQNYQEKAANNLQGLLTTENTPTNNTFTIEFSLREDPDGTERIYAYQIMDYGINNLTDYALQMPASEVQSFQVWGQFEKINELTFFYD